MFENRIEVLDKNKINPFIDRFFEDNKPQLIEILAKDLNNTLLKIKNEVEKNGVTKDNVIFLQHLNDFNKYGFLNEDVLNQADKNLLEFNNNIQDKIKLSLSELKNDKEKEIRYDEAIQNFIQLVNNIDKAINNEIKISKDELFLFIDKSDLCLSEASKYSLNHSPKTLEFIKKYEKLKEKIFGNIHNKPSQEKHEKTQINKSSESDKYKITERKDNKLENNFDTKFNKLLSRYNEIESFVWKVFVDYKSKYVRYFNLNGKYRNIYIYSFIDCFNKDYSIFLEYKDIITNSTIIQERPDLLQYYNEWNSRIYSSNVIATLDEIAVKLKNLKKNDNYDKKIIKQIDLAIDDVYFYQFVRYRSYKKMEKLVEYGIYEWAKDINDKKTRDYFYPRIAHEKALKRKGISKLFYGLFDKLTESIRISSNYRFYKKKDKKMKKEFDHIYAIKRRYEE